MIGFGLKELIYGCKKETEIPRMLENGFMLTKLLACSENVLGLRKKIGLLYLLFGGHDYWKRYVNESKEWTVF